MEPKMELRRGVYNHNFNILEHLNCQCLNKNFIVVVWIRT